MVVVFLDGVDGSGKTTLLNGLVCALAPTRTVTAQPLWRYLPALTTPADFGPWVTSTDADHVGGALLTGQIERIHTLRSLARAAADPVVLLVDRGPATVVASARAHLRTGIRAGDRGRIDLAGHVDRLRDAVERLGAETACLSIELAADRGPDRILSRLTAEDRASPGYLRYLHALRHEIGSGVPTWVGLRRVPLDATHPVNINLTAALVAVRGILTGPGAPRDMAASRD